MALKDVFLLKIVFCVEWLTCFILCCDSSGLFGSVCLCVSEAYLSGEVIYVFAYLKQ
jgi:hypothetical protein